jgi:hypothetical protein
MQEKFYYAVRKSYLPYERIPLTDEKVKLLS